jgi:DNA-binding FadR family transcriptional regulator
MAAGQQIKRVKQPRLAELVAASLRDDIVTGTLKEGDELPPFDELLDRFEVSPPVGREAIRILETEGLLSVRRGNVGGAVIHLPSAARVGYMASLVLQSERVQLADVGIALRELEPRCAALCADVPGRDAVVLPELEALIEQEERHGESAGALAADRFHDVLVDACGNDALALAVRALQAIWNGHLGQDVEAEPAAGVAHRQIAELIAGDDLPAVYLSEQEHLLTAGRYVRDDDLPVDHARVTGDHGARTSRALPGT